MYVIIAGGGKVGSNIARSLLEMQHEVTLIEQRRDRFAQLEAEFGHAAMLGDATEIAVLERAGIARPPDLVLAVTGDDEDNLIISQIAKEGYGVPKAIARVNDPRNQQHFDLLGITRDGLRDIGPPRARRARGARARPRAAARAAPRRARGRRGAGARRTRRQQASASPACRCPTVSRLVSVMRNGVGEIAVGETVIRPGDQVIAILKPGAEDKLRRALVG